MARKRIIDTDLYFDSEICDLLGDRGLHLYFRLWGIADDSGVYEPRYSDIALQMGALNFKPNEVQDFIQKLIDKGKIIPFTSNGVAYHWIKNLMKHQPLNNPSPPRHPLPEWISCEIKKYPSGKNFAVYQILNEKLPKITGSLPVDYPSVETKRNVTKRNVTLSSSPMTCPQPEIMDLYHKILPELPRISKWTPERLKKLLAFQKSDPKRQEPEWWQKYFEAVRESSFLLGKGPRGWRANIDWLLKEGNFLKVKEGHHADKGGER